MTDIKNMTISQLQDVKFTDAAIRFSWGADTVIITGRRHHNIIKKIADIGLTEEYKACHEDGFMISINGGEMFIDRNTAKVVADALGIETHSETLCSEDLW